jgi:RNAse (barnase) inhibitor barstar
MTAPKRTAIINCVGLRSEDEFWQRYLDTTTPRAPASFGRNLDAFWDAIEAGGPGCPVDLDHLHFVNLEQFLQQSSLGETWYKGLQKIAEDATQIKVTLSLGGTV